MRARRSPVRSLSLDCRRTIPVAEQGQVIRTSISDCFPQPNSTGYVLELAQGGKLFDIKMPISTSKLLFPAYGRQVAIDLHEEQCDVIHIQHCSQYVPIIRAKNPTAKIVLHIHADGFHRATSRRCRRRLEGVDCLLTVSDHIARKCRRDFPTIADRCETMYCGIDPKEFSRVKDYTAATERREKRILYTAPFRRIRASTC